MRPSAASTLHVKVPPWAEMHLLHYGRIPGPNVQSRANLTERYEYTSILSVQTAGKNFFTLCLFPKTGFTFRQATI